MSQVEELLNKALSTETFFTTLSAETRLEMLAVLVVDRILADLENGKSLLESLKGRGRT